MAYVRSSRVYAGPVRLPPWLVTHLEQEVRETTKPGDSWVSYEMTGRRRVVLRGGLPLPWSRSLYRFDVDWGGE